MERKPFLFAISGVKNAGKTTLITKLISVFAKRGLKVATIKHDGHEFEPDVPGTDTYRHLEAGAYGTVVFSKGKYMLVKQQPEISAEQLIAFFPEADLILLEGMKHSPYPKIEVIRKGISEKMVCEEGVVAVASDFHPLLPKEVPCYDLNQAETLAEVILTERFIRTELSAIILAGGRSSRMGTDKADLHYRTETFLEHQIKKARKLGISDLIISGYRGQQCLEKVVKDVYCQKGPLGGLEASLREARHKWCLVFTVDMPLLSVQELYLLIQQSQKSTAPATILSHQKNLEPLVGVYKAELAEAIQQELLQGKGSVRALLDKVGYEVYESTAPEELFQNINTPEEYDKMGGK